MDGLAAFEHTIQGPAKIRKVIAQVHGAQQLAQRMAGMAALGVLAGADGGTELLAASAPAKSKALVLRHAALRRSICVRMRNHLS